MAIPFFAHRWFRLPSRIALILGLGALSTTSVGAPTDAQANQTASGDALIRSDGGKIYLLEGGRETELQLGATPQRDRLLRLLEEHGPAGVKLDHDPRLIMSSGGGAGFYWWGQKKSATEGTTPSGSAPPPQATAPSGSPKQSAPRDRSPASDKKE
jgi:hypothetical protein